MVYICDLYLFATSRIILLFLLSESISWSIKDICRRIDSRVSLDAFSKLVRRARASFDMWGSFVDGPLKGKSFDSIIHGSTDNVFARLFTTPIVGFGSWSSERILLIVL